MMLIDAECTCGSFKGTGEPYTGEKCKHSEKALNLIESRKTISKIGVLRECEKCENENKITPPVVEDGIEPCPPGMWMCLQCGNQACGNSDRNHANQHFNTPRTGSHCLVIDTYEWKLWCYQCNGYINPKSCFRMSRLVTDIIRMSTEATKRKKSSPKASKKEVAELKKVKVKFEVGFTKVVGLSNLGNTCFFNAVLQCLAQTPFLLKVLEDMQIPGQTFVLPGGMYKKPGGTEKILLPPIEGTLDKECSLTQVLQKTLTDMQNSNGETYKPSELLNSLRKKNTQCMDGGQHDSHELLRHLLEQVRSEDLRRYQEIILKNLDLYKKAKNNDDDKVWKLKLYGHQASARLLGTEPVFKGILVSTLECLECHHSTRRTESFLDLSLPVMVDKPQPPSHRRKSSGFEDAFDLMNSNNSSKNAHKSSRKRMKRVAKSKNSKQKNYSASGSESDAEDNAETDADTESNSKSQEINESGYSSEKPSQLTSPASPDNDSSNEIRNDSTVNSMNECESIENNCELVENGNSQEKMNSMVVDNNEDDNDNNDNNDDDDSSKLQKFIELNLEISNVKNDKQFLDESPLNNDELPENNLITNVNNSSESSSSSPVNEKEVNDEKLIVNDNGEETKENGEDTEEKSLRYAREEKEDKKVNSKVNNECNNDYSKTNGVEKIRSEMSQMKISQVSQSPSRYTTCEGEFSIQSCLNQFTAKELMANNNAVGCEACTARENKGKENGKMVRTPSTKQYLISNVPAVLILHLKRFQSHRMSFSKVTKYVKFPTVLNLAPICENHDVPKVYSLYGVVEHSGTLYGGHYVAYVKTRQPLSPDDPRWSFLPKQESTESETLENNETTNSEEKSEKISNSSNVESLPGQWYYISDSRVTETDENTVLKSQAYLLFYERIL
ncbi:ubiquitin carboxyl-terminal hydrolase 16 [Leptopilina heterotoma]|uniref:ubiquitin carboxyl-terminal hydrolase 16 n=1 Tax=Leptopilina heterotoma TaxID=63436 RepID=UPI001CA9C480|nr:ubiquitin carboxyl-terminal hydrolase 16 [Leptopilina heterotoma]XP_043484420.1 ubiquitin carboxyl-terminal hydrolase 16 [Leptopilina heterotoma]XP_043484421.1 ubiquitin carboxyl-terminal hydrolase 16 [Leptopilina heterotoma]